jgi:hypothetical protein
LGKTLETQLAEANQALDSSLDELSKNAPAGTEIAVNASVAAVKSAIGASGTAYATFSKAVRQVNAYAESNLAPTSKPTPKTKKAA